MAKKRIQHEIRLIIILAVLSAIFFGLAFGIRAMESHKEDENSKYTEMAVMTELPGRVEVTDSIEHFILESEKGSWYYTENRDIPISDFKVTETRTAAKYFSPGRIITDCRDKWQDFGLEDPQCITRLRAENEDITYLIGNFNPVTNEYYVAVEGSDIVYMIAKRDGESLSKNIFEYVDYPEITNAVFSNIQGIRVETGEGTYNINLENGRYMVSTPEEAFEIDQSKVMAIFNCFTTSGDYSCVEYDAGETVLREYGLDEPAVKVFFTEGDNGAEYDMFVGCGSDGGYYICGNAKNIIYSFEESAFGTLMDDIKVSNLR